MNGLQSNLAEVQTVANELRDHSTAAEALLCVPATLVHRAVEVAKGSKLRIGGETCHSKESGAHTGDVSAEMLQDAGARYVIVGHSERRADHGETDEMVATQASAAYRAGVVPIICVGESLEQRENGETLDVIKGQLTGSIPSNSASHEFVVAYEPIWAIGTGKVADTDQIGEVHAFVRDALSELFAEAGSSTRILYGGSMKPGNAAEILAIKNVNGGLIGGASLKAADFMAIYASA